VSKNYSKQDYEKVFNELLGTNIKWSRLPKEDLAQLAVIFANPEILLKRLGIEIEQSILRKKIANAFSNLLENIELEGPVIRFLRDIVGVSSSKKQETPDK